MEDAPPPTEHILRPHHLVLLSILMIAFKDLELKKFPPEFSTHLLRILLNEVSEVTEPLTFRELMKAIAAGAPSPHRDVAQFMAAINVVHTDIYSTEKLGNFLTNLPQLFVENPRAPPEEKTRLARRSIFGYFCRRCFVSYVKLSYGGLSNLREDYQAWCTGDRKAGYEPIPKDHLTTSYLIHKTQVDKKTWAKPDTYAAWEKARAVGDESVAVESIRSFFEQHFHDQSDSGFRQHALLNVVHMHYLNKEYVAAGKLLHEAIGVARTANDRPTLQHCLSLLRRLPPPPGVKPFLNEAQPDMHPFEVLYDVRKLLDEEHEQPISTAFNKFVEAVGLYDHWLEAHSAVPHADHQWAQHAVQSVIWREAGCERLAQASEEVVLSFTEPGSDSSTRLVVILNKAHQMARQGQYHESLGLLLEPSTWQGLTMNDYGSWAHEVWNVLTMRAIRRGQERLYREYLLPWKPAGEWNSKHYTFEPANDRLSPIRESLYQVLRLKSCEQLSNSVDALLNALWLSEFLGRYHAYRSAIILLADFGLQYGMPKRSKRLLEEILPQIIKGGDREQRGVACFTLARCLLVSEGTSNLVLLEALYYLEIAEADFKELQMYSSWADVAYFSSVLYENLGQGAKRDEAARRLEEIESQRMSLEVEVLDPEVQEALRHMDGPPPPEEDFSTLSIADRLAHKNWKARVNGYESLIKTFQNTASDTDPAFKPYLNNTDLIKKIASDSNAVAQEKGVECLVALVKFSGESAAKTRDAIVPVLVDKCLGSTRAGTKNQALELILQYVEVENGAAGVVGDILPGLGAKQPKAVAGSVVALKEIVRCFGIQVAPPPPILKALPKIFDHKDKTVRAEGTTLVHTLYQYLGPAIESFLGDLKPVQVKELKEAFEGLEKEEKGKGSIKPGRLTRQQAREAETQGDAGDDAADDAPADEPEEFDPRSLAEVVDVVPKLPSAFQTAIKSSKWKERKEVLDEAATVFSSTLRIKDSPELSEVARSMATCIAKDANINCVIVAANCLEHLAKGMGTPFGKFREAVVPLMLARLKERKANVTDAIGGALDALFATVSLTDILPDLEPSLKDKNPQVKEGTLKFLGRSLSTATSPIPPAQIKPLSESLATLLEDGFEGARNEAATCFGCLMKMVGERPLNAIMDTMADVRKAKVKEAYEKATVKCKAGAAPARAPPGSAPKASGPAKKAPPKTAAKEEPRAEPPPPKKPAPKPPAAAAKKPPAVAATASKSAPAASGSGAKGKSAPAAAAGSLDSFKYKHTPEDAEPLAADIIPANFLNDLGDGNWKTRLAALEEMTTWVEEQAESLDAEVVVRALAKKGWSEKNFQVSSKLYGILSLLSKNCPSFGRSCVALSVAHLSEKLGDLKLKKPAGETLLDFAERTSLQFVLSQAYDPLSKQKAPKVLADSMTWISSALTDFGIAGVSLRALIDFLKTALANSNAAVRTNTTKTLVTVKLFAGSSVKDLLEDVNPQLLNTISSEFDKVEGTPAPVPTRTSVDLQNMGSDSGGGGKGAAAGGADPLDDLFPRVELDGLLKGTTILADAKSDAWKTKKEALEGLQAILDQGSNKRLKPSMGEIGQVLKARVTDTNKAVQALALDIVARIASGMGKPFDKHSRLYALPVATVLSDQKAPIRNAAIQTLAAIAEACEGVDSLVAGFATAMESSNPLQKSTLMNWLAQWLAEHESASAPDLHAWAPHVVGSLDDRSGDVRKGAQALLPFVIRFAGYDFVMQQTNALKPASKASAVPLIQAARPASAPDVPVAAPAPSAKKLTSAPASAKSASPAPPSPTASAAPSAPAAGARAVPKLGVRRKIPQSSSSRPESRAETPESGLKPPGGLKRPSASMAARAASPAQSTVGVFHGMNPDAKRPRLGKDVQKWINEGGPTRKDLAEALQSQMEPVASKELVSKLFSHDHSAVNDHIAGLGMIAEFYASAFGDETLEKICIANIDLPLKYVSIKVHESQSNLVAKCLDVVDAVLEFLRNVNYQLTDSEATCFAPTMVFKLGDAREPVRNRVSQIIRNLPKVYAYSRVFHALLDNGLKSKVAKTRQGSLDEMSVILKKSGMGACEPSKALPVIASFIGDKDPAVRKSALAVLSEVYSLVGEKVWGLVGPLSPKDKTQLEERLRRVPGPSSHERQESTGAGIAPPAGVARLAGAGGLARPGSPAASRGLRSASPVMMAPESPSRSRAGSAASQMQAPSSPTGIARPKSFLPGPSRLARPRTNIGAPPVQPAPRPLYEDPLPPVPAARAPEPPRFPRSLPISRGSSSNGGPTPAIEPPADTSDDITIIISTILSSDPSRSVDALKKIQKILSISPDAGPSSAQYRDLAEHTEGLVETITLQMAHVFERPEELLPDDNFRLAKHLIQTLNNFCDHAFLAESLTVEILTSLLEELTLRLLETDESPTKKIKDLSRFINMIILRLFATGRRMSIFRALFALLLQIVKPFPAKGALPDSKEAKVAELVLKCVWKLARNIPQDLADAVLDPVELFPAVEHFLQSVPPNEWRARATNKVPCGDMPLRTIKVIIQHVVAHYGEEVYELLSASFEDPSATIVYPYVFRILNAAPKANGGANGGPPPGRNGDAPPDRYASRPISPASSRPRSPPETASSIRSNREFASHRTASPASSSANGHPTYSPAAEEPDPDGQLLTIINHISSETTGALHKEGITELHHFLKAYPHKRPRVEKMLESTGAAFRKYINRALASRAAEDQERDIAVTDTLNKLEARTEPGTPTSPQSPTRPTSRPIDTNTQDKLSRLHGIFQYNRSSTASAGSSQGHARRTSHDLGSA